MRDPLELEPGAIINEPAKNPNLIKPWQIVAVALVAIASWLAISGWILLNEPTEAERSGILEVAKTFATLAFGYFLGSSAGSRNKDHQ